MNQLLWSNIENASTLFGLVGSVAAFCAWLQTKKISKDVRLEKERLNQEIKIVLQGDDEHHCISLAFAFRRQELTRSELLGLIGMLPTKNKQRFAIDFFSTADFRVLLSKIQDDTKETAMNIPCTNDEIDQFVWKN